MSVNTHQRIKLLYLMKIMLELTDEDNPLTANQLSDELAVYGVKAERKTIYMDLELLSLFGLDIEQQRGKNAGYYIASRRFERPELKLLVDAVQSSRFISKKKSGELIDKLASLTSKAYAGQLRRQVFVTNRAKSLNEHSYYSVDTIHTAIAGKNKISFKYFDYNVKRRRVYRKNGGSYQVTPLALCWDNDKYYLVAYSAEHDELRHYRVDRMSDTAVLDEPADTTHKKRFNVSKHIGQIFGMYNGEIVNATLIFDKKLVNNILDHFGSNATLTATEDGRVMVQADISVSPVFFSWIFQFGKQAKIVAPESLKRAMLELIEENAQNYR